MADDSAADNDRETTLRRWWAVAGLALFGATWRLWTPQTEFPQVPLFGWANSVPSFLDWLAFGALLGSLAVAVWKPESRRSWIVFEVSLGVLLMLDQHRLQPWAWQLLLMAMWWSSASVGHVSNMPGRALAGHVGNVPHVVLTVSIYFWSAISKLDAAFIGSHGQTLIEALFRSVGINAVNWPASCKSWLALSLPVGELLVAIGLSWPRTRRAALIGATALHVGLILALGPLGLGHRPGVLLWNVAFIGHDWLLFGRCAFGRSALTRRGRDLLEPRPSGSGVFERGQPLPDGRGSGKSQTLRVGVMAFVCVWPITERWGLCDRWLAWSVYSARSERVLVTLTDEGLRRLPESARRCATDGEVPLDRWSLAALDVPITPQLRFQFGVAEWLRRRCGEEHVVEVIVQHSPGAGGDVERLTVEQFDEYRRLFWINAQPRDASLAGSRR